MDDKKIREDIETKLGYNPETHREYTVQDYYADMAMIMKGRMPTRPMGLPVPVMDVSGITFLLAIPVLLFWVFIKDPFYDWFRWRVIGVAVSSVVMALMLLSSVLFSVAFNLQEDSFIINLMLNIGTAGLLSFIVMIWPRTTVLLIILALVISVIGFLISLF